MCVFHSNHRRRSIRSEYELKLTDSRLSTIYCCYEVLGGFLDFKWKFIVRIDARYTTYRTHLKLNQQIVDFPCKSHFLSKSFNKPRFWNFEKLLFFSKSFSLASIHQNHFISKYDEAVTSNKPSPVLARPSDAVRYRILSKSLRIRKFPNFRG